jgi:RHS repeat-associated protein
VLHSTHTRVINTLNEIYQEINAAGTAAVTTTFGYDSNGNQTSIAAPLARNTTNAYDELNRLDQITDPNSGITKFTYDANDNLTSVLDPRTLATGYTYNGLGDLTQLTSPDTAGTSHTYDSGGNLATSTDARGAISTYTYDAQNRVKTVAYKLGSTTDLTETYTYDTGTNGKGHLTGASDANHSMSWGYDALVRVVSKGQKIGSVTKTVGYAFTNGDLTTLTTPSGQTVTYGYNTNHQVTSISIGGVALLGAVTYEPLGPANGWTWANNTTEIRSYDTDANPNQVSAIESHTYGYDDALRITSIANGSNSALSWTYGFDLLDRITSASKTGLTQDWTYDANGNRLTETGTVAGSYNVSATSNRLNSITGSPARIYTYDNAGNTLTYANTLTYYNNGRMKTAKVGSSTTTYVYNALGQRVKKSGGSAGTVLMFYDEAGHILGEYSSTGALVQETVWMGDIPVATIRPNGSTTAVYNVHADHLNAPRMVTQSSSTNKIAWRWDTDPFATVTPNQNPAGLGTFKYNLRYPGQYFDSETGLLQNYFRDYDPAVGKYVESDPIGLRGGINTYGYVGENPLSNFDSFGLSSLIFNPATGTMTVVNGDGVAVGVFPAGNNTDSHSRGAWPAGDYDYSRHTTHPDDAPDSAFGSYGNYIFNVPGCHDQCGVHSGRNSVPDGLGRIGVKHATNGCIRTTDAAMQLIANLINGGDPLTGVMVTSSFVPTNIPAIAPGLPGGPPLYLPDPGR